MKICDINIRDPFVLVHEGKYYMYGTRGETAWSRATGFDVYVSDDLNGEWTGPKEVLNSCEFGLDYKNNWAPEVHLYNGSFYMFATFSTPDTKVRCQILRADTPDGKFVPHSHDFVTPTGWHCLDATLYVDKSQTPYMVFCHEHTQVIDGRMCLVELSGDLTHAVGEPITLFSASMPAWADTGAPRYITDGPFLYDMENGSLAMIWSSIADDNYIQAISFSQSGDIKGPWVHRDVPLFAKDGGHGMLFKNLDGQLMLTLHRPNKNPLERPHFFDVAESNGDLTITNL